MKPIYLFITPFFPSPKIWRGAYGYDFVQALIRSGRYEVIVYKTNRDNVPDYDYRGVHVRCLRRINTPSGVLHQLLTLLNQRIFLKRLKADGLDMSRVAVVDGFSPDCGIYCAVIKRLNRKACWIIHHHDCGSFGVFSGRFRHFWPLKVLNFLLSRQLQACADLHVFISDLVRKSFLSFPDTSWSDFDDYRRISCGIRGFAPVRIKDGYVLQNGVDLRQFNKKGRVPHSRFEIGCVANFGTAKGQLDLLKALNLIGNQISDWRLRFVGSGLLLEKCQHFVVEHGLNANVEFLTEVDHSKLPDFYRSIDLFVLPSYWEGFGCAYTEAWACGAAFIACKNGPMEEVLSPEQNRIWLCNPKDEVDLADKILYFYANREKQVLNVEIDIDKLVCNYLDVLERLL